MAWEHPLFTSYSARPEGDLFDALARLRPPLILTILLLLTGTLGYMAIDGYPFLDAMYMTVISVATVGFGELHPLSSAGRVFTMALIMGGFSVFTYAIGVFVEVVARRDLFALVGLKRMETRIRALSDHYIVVGYTPIAQELARVFRRRGVTFVVIEGEANRLRQLKSDGVELYIQGDCFHNESYKRAAVESARGIITTFKSDADNITVAVTGRIFEEATGRDLFIVSTCSGPESKARLERVGADYVVSPDSLIGTRIGALAIRPPTEGHTSILERVAFGEYTELDLHEVVLDAGCRIVGKTIRESDLRRKTGAYIVAIKRTGKKVNINPAPEVVMQAGDTLMVIGTPAQLAGLEAHLAAGGDAGRGGAPEAPAEVAGAGPD
jgi:voltage-gated potassium channel